MSTQLNMCPTPRLGRCLKAVEAMGQPRWTSRANKQRGSPREENSGGAPLWRRPGRDMRFRQPGSNRDVGPGSSSRDGRNTVHASAWTRPVRGAGKRISRTGLRMPPTLSGSDSRFDSGSGSGSDSDSNSAADSSSDADADADSTPVRGRRPPTLSDFLLRFWLQFRRRSRRPPNATVSRLSNSQFSKRYVSPSARTYPAAGATKCVPTTSTG